MSKGADFNREEQLQARRDGAILVKNSGRGLRKGDARRGNLLIDYKFTSAKSFALNIEAFAKHERDAWNENLVPCIVPIFETYKSRCLATVPWDYLMELEDRVKELEDLCGGSA